ncbi:hypothetical protein GCM10023085_23790 [Actinomadura viridis]|uniref:Uncharacterized protein n=1 Tax=Actinomadura viridis TaxID=58110 RepID=A0A931DJM3_9ACTN|nr:hypothetical protein [Actinomadura viridis]MBG6088751.1 hypothetical protein [Actinomadura viridis]
MPAALFHPLADPVRSPIVQRPARGEARAVDLPFYSVAAPEVSDLLRPPPHRPATDRATPLCPAHGTGADQQVGACTPERRART